MGLNQSDTNTGNDLEFYCLASEKSLVLVLHKIKTTFPMNPTASHHNDNVFIFTEENKHVESDFPIDVSYFPQFAIVMKL